MGQDETRAIAWDCTQVLLRFYHAFDGWDYEGMVGLFTENGVWRRAGKALVGRDAIMAEMRRRPTTQVIRHVVTNILVDVHDATHAQATFYLTAYRHDTGQARIVPAPMSLPAMLLVVTVQLIRCEDGWRIAEQTMQREFERTG